ncbi:hypothetical protein C0995_014779 [Termitomyces sp. Mi166|nr:hypothetical protein C0995_014779 [Termitomyces sp. Mi166\
MYLKTLLVSLYLISRRALASNAQHQYSTHRLLNVSSTGLKVEIFHPETTYEVRTFLVVHDQCPINPLDKIFGTGLEQQPAFVHSSLRESAIETVASLLGVANRRVVYKNGFGTETAKVAYLNQAHAGIPFSNAVANVVWRDGKVVAIGSSFVSTGWLSDSHSSRAYPSRKGTADNIAPSEPSLPAEAVIPSAEDLLDGKYNGHPTSLEYLVRPDGSVALAHVIQIQNDESGSWYEAFMDAHSGDLLSITDFIADAAYRVLPIEKQALSEGQEMVEDPQDPESSHLGWHNDGTAESQSTSGNNVIAFKRYLENVTYQNAEPLVFDYTYDDKIAPTAGENIDAVRTNGFYIINTVHDFAYRYGFTEAASNFQVNNFGKGGKESDPVLMSVQDSSGVNNANFGTPPEFVFFYHTFERLVDPN